MLCRVPGGKSFLGCGTITTLPSSCLSFIWLPLWLTRTNPSFSSLLRTSLLFMSFLYATCATKSRKNAYVAHRTLLVTGYEKRRRWTAFFVSNNISRLGGYTLVPRTLFKWKIFIQYTVLIRINSSAASAPSSSIFSLENCADAIGCLSLPLLGHYGIIKA